MKAVYTKVKNLSDAVYGHVSLYQQQQRKEHSEPTLVIIKKMSISHMDRKVSVADNIPVEEDGRSEIKIMKRLPHHPNVVSLITSFKDSKSIYLVSEYCSNGDLYDDVQSNCGIDIEKAMTYFRQIVSGLSHLHSHNIAHRDVSLENVLMDGNGICKISDMGLSIVNEKGDMVQSDVRVGKRFYMSPEVYAGDKYDPFKADMWSLGVLLYILATGEPLYSNATMEDSRFASVVKTCGISQVLNASRKSLPEPVVQLIDSLLVLNPSSRLDIEQVERMVFSDEKGNITASGSNMDLPSKDFCSTCNKKFRWYRTPKVSRNDKYCRKCIKFLQ